MDELMMPCPLPERSQPDELPAHFWEAPEPWVLQIALAQPGLPIAASEQHLAPAGT
jgi:hypothetical protein